VHTDNFWNSSIFIICPIEFIAFIEKSGISDVKSIWSHSAVSSENSEVIVFCVWWFILN